MRGLSLFLLLTISSQAMAYQLIIRFRGYTAARLLQKYKEPKELRSVINDRDVLKYNPLIPELGIYLLTIPTTYSRSAARQVVYDIHRKYHLRYAVFNARLRLRKNYYTTTQWPLNGQGSGTANAAKAWKDFGAGGNDRNFKNPVAAIVDDGVDITHPNLKANIWINGAEVPGDGIDNDGNGYIDDIHGWNVVKNNGKVESGGHGTHVAGIVSAHSTEKNTIYGISPTTKLMVLNATGGMDLTSNALKAYGYVLKQKKLWLATKGQKGANVVSVNSSFGIDQADCNSDAYSSWNDMYNELGKVGVLSVVATSNMRYDVDEMGDVPSGCKSPYVVAVGNVGVNGKPSGAFGKNSVDLHAPGTEVTSTYPGGRFTALTGTSMATPHVTGAVAYLYKISEDTMANIALNKSPDKLALFMKKVIMNSIRPKDNLGNLTQTGGVLDLHRAAVLMQKSVRNSRNYQRR